jgi:membrane protease YdiL (CAAX protease family)
MGSRVRIPIVVWLAPVFLFLTLVPGGVWAALLVANLSTSPTIPWAVAVMALLLWLMWQYLGGKWWPHSTSDARRRCLRARGVSAKAFAWSVAAGVLSIVALSGLWIVLFQLVNVQGNLLPDFSKYPAITVALVLAMAALVGAVAEEAGIRGYFQGLLEERVGGPPAILIAALVMAPGHGLSQGFAWPTMVFYLFVDVMFGVTAWLNNSILPGLVVHLIGLMVFFALVWPGDAARRLVGESGVDPWFWLHVAQAVIFAALAVLAFRHLAKVTPRDSRRQAGARGAPAID